MKTILTYPSWVEKYRTPGHTIKKTKQGYALYSCTSVYVKGQKPKSVQTYLGRITQKDGFVSKTVVSSQPEYLEFGLSHFIMANYKRELQRTVYDANIMIIYLGIIDVVFGSINDYFIQHCALTYNQAEGIIQYYHHASSQRIQRIRKKIESLIQNSVPDESQRDLLIQGLKLCVIEKNRIADPPLHLPVELIQIIERFGCHYDKTDHQ